MIETTYVRLEQAAKMLDTDADTLLIAAAEGRVRLYALVAEWREAQLLLHDYDEWTGDVVVGQRPIHVIYAPIHQIGAARILRHGQTGVYQFTEDRPLSEDMIEILKKKYQRTEWVTHWAHAADGENEDPPVASRESIFLKYEAVHSIRDKGNTPSEGSVGDCLSMPERLHISDSLQLLNHAAQKWWANASKSDPLTHPKNASVVAWLIERGLSKSQAEKSASIIRPDWAHTGRKPDA